MTVITCKKKIEELIDASINSRRTLFLLEGDRYDITRALNRYILVIRHVVNNIVSVDSRFIDQLEPILLEQGIIMHPYTLGDDTLINK
jgi:hypothetical protein